MPHTEPPAVSAGPDPAIGRLVLTPFHVAGFVLLAVGFVLSVHQGLQAFDAVGRAAWVRWSHIHVVTVGVFTQLLFGMLPQLTARKLEIAPPPAWYWWSSFTALNGGFLAAWWGRASGTAWSYDLGLVVIWLTVLALLAMLVSQAARADAGSRDTTVGLYLVAPAVFLIGLTFAFALYTDTFAFEVPGGWWGLREGHVHANAWGFLGLAAMGTLYDLFPRLVQAPLHNQRSRRWSVWLLVAGIGPLAIGPVLGMGRSVTGTGLALFAGGYVLYLANLVRTYRAGTRSGLARMVLVAQIWILGPAGFAPFILFGVPLGIEERLIETGALHFFFVGWALPVALAGLALWLRNLPRPAHADRIPVDASEPLPLGVVPGTVVATWMIWAWNLAVLVVGLGFFYPDHGWSAVALGGGFTVLTLLWGYLLVRIAEQRWRLVTALKRRPPLAINDSVDKG